MDPVIIRSLSVHSCPRTVQIGLRKITDTFIEGLNCELATKATAKKSIENLLLAAELG
jgi:hypothetical protein